MTAAEVDPLGTLPMFDIPEPAARPAPRVSPSTGAPRWAKYRPKVAANCHDCIAHLHQAAGHAQAPAKARHKRTAGVSTRLLCDEHAQQWRERDQLGGGR